MNVSNGKERSVWNWLQQGADGRAKHKAKHKERDVCSASWNDLETRFNASIEAELLIDRLGIYIGLVNILIYWPNQQETHFVRSICH